ncbi:MAG: XrtA/PEP-CTERM system histidine kinase PrsK [Erythrobacter sp.]
MILNSAYLSVFGYFGYLFGAIACAIGFLIIARKGEADRADRGAAMLAVILTGVWCAMAAALGTSAPSTLLAEIARNFSWIFLILKLFANDGRDESLRPIRPVIFTLAFVELLQPVLLVAVLFVAASVDLAGLTFQIIAFLRMLSAIGALVLLHNLYAGGSASSRQLLRWSAIALAWAYAYDLNLYTIAYLSDSMPSLLVSLRGTVVGIFVVLLAFGSISASAGLQFRPSRAVAFQSLSLVVIGAYLFGLMVITQSLSLLGGEVGRLMQIGFLVLASIAAIVWLPSQRMRGWLRVTAIKHLFQHRYDYREEWLRFTSTIGHANSRSDGFHERAVRAMADITESPGGLLLSPNEEAELELVARWQWPTIEITAPAGSYQMAALLEERNFVLGLDEVRAGKDHHGENALVPDWLRNAEDAWAVVPLLHFDRLVGAVVLARPKGQRSLDWEDFDLLRVVGQQLASYLAEQSGQEALLEANRFDEFNRRIAFVMHDIKNLASQLSLLARNAEKHADNPDFRADMLVTLRNSADKLNALLARLGRYGSGQVQTRELIDLSAVVATVVARFRDNHDVTITRSEACKVYADAEGLEQALIHLVQNAVDASEPGTPVFLQVSSDGLSGQVEIVDSGAGMSPGFVRNGLFKPFVSSKNGGFGIGAYEAREIIRAMGGRLNVESREGIGTRFVISLTVAAAQSLLSKNANAGASVGNPNDPDTPKDTQSEVA